MTDVDFTHVVVEVRDGKPVRAYSTLHKLGIKLTVREYSIPWVDIQYFIRNSIADCDPKNVKYVALNDKNYYKDDNGNWYEVYEI